VKHTRIDGEITSNAEVSSFCFRAFFQELGQKPTGSFILNRSV